MLLKTQKIVVLVYKIRMRKKRKLRQNHDSILYQNIIHQVVCYFHTKLFYTTFTIKKDVRLFLLLTLNIHFKKIFFWF